MLLILRRFLLFRLKQAYRMLLDIGGINLILLIPLIIVFGLSLLAFFFGQKGLLPVILVLGLLGTVHFQRKDSDFIALLRVPKPVLYSVEYLFYSLPVLIVLGIFGHWEQLLYILGGIPIIGFSPQINLANPIKNWTAPNIGISPFLWEFRALWYQAPFYAITTVIVGIVASFWLVGYIAFMVIFTFYLAATFQMMEGKEILSSVYLENNFLSKKIRLASQFWLVVTIPMHLILLVTHSEYFFLPLISITWMLFSLSFAIYLKYAHYHPSRERFYSSLGLTLFSVGLFIPFLLPVALIFWFRMRNKAHKNLQYYA